MRVPGIAPHLAEQVAEVVRSVRQIDLKKSPSVSETIDWARTLIALGIERVDEEAVSATLHVLLKHQSDVEKVAKEFSLQDPLVGPHAVEPDRPGDDRHDDRLRRRAAHRRGAGVDGRGDRRPRRLGARRSWPTGRPSSTPLERPWSRTSGTSEAFDAAFEAFFALHRETSTGRRRHRPAGAAPGRRQASGRRSRWGRRSTSRSWPGRSWRR